MRFSREKLVFLNLKSCKTAELSCVFLIKKSRKNHIGSISGKLKKPQPNNNKNPQRVK